MLGNLDGSRRVTALLQTPANERNPEVSPEERWLAYDSDESGRFEVYMRPFPDVNSGRFQVSSIGGTHAHWSSDGRELFHVAASGAVMSVKQGGGSAWALSSPSVVVKEGYATLAPISVGRKYDMARDGQRFVMMKEPVLQDPKPSVLIVVQNVLDELRRLAPPR